jgi:hypothetical protein
VNVGLNRRAPRQRASVRIQTQGSRSLTAKAMPEAGGIDRLNGRYNLAATDRPRAFSALPKFWIFSEKPENHQSKVQSQHDNFF